jgi:hypothetical protein
MVSLTPVVADFLPQKVRSDWVGLWRLTVGQAQDQKTEYRRQAKLAREHAETARTPEIKEGFLQMAQEWDKLADAVAKDRT